MKGDLNIQKAPLHAEFVSLPYIIVHILFPEGKLLSNSFQQVKVFLCAIQKGIHITTGFIKKQHKHKKFKIIRSRKENHMHLESQ